MVYSALSTRSPTLSVLSSTWGPSLSARGSVSPTTTATTSCSPPSPTTGPTSASSSMSATPTPPPARTPQTATSLLRDQKLPQSLMHAAKRSEMLLVRQSLRLGTSTTWQQRPSAKVFVETPPTAPTGVSTGRSASSTVPAIILILAPPSAQVALSFRMSQRVRAQIPLKLS